MNVEDFCSKKGDLREYLSTPSIYKNHVFGCDGRRILFSPKFGDFKETPEKIKKVIKEYIVEIDAALYEECPEIILPDKTQCYRCKGARTVATFKCLECSGDGFVCFENHYSKYENECYSCDGKGAEYKPTGDSLCEVCEGSGYLYEDIFPIEIGGNIFDQKVIDIIAGVPNLMVSHGENKIYFKCGSKSGLIMGVKK